MTRIPHDPPSMDDPRCPDCETPWPCEERRRQRQLKRQVDHLLRSDLYEPTSQGDHVRWASPLGWTVTVSYGPVALDLEIFDPSGNLYAGATNADASWLDGNLP